MSPSARRIAFQGMAGAYSELACREAFPMLEPLPCPSFEDAFAAVREGEANRAMIPVDNTVAGRVADVYHLLPTSGLHIVGEHFQSVRHQLLAVEGATLDGIRRVRSHVHALSQCRDLIRRLGVTPEVTADTAGAAAQVAAEGDPTVAAIASTIAARTYGLKILASDVEDQDGNTTRMLIMTREASVPAPHSGHMITSFVFRVRSVPAALYKALGGFATNNVNLTKLESYMVDSSFAAAQFYVDCEGHPEERPLRLALEELTFFSRELKILGVYPAHPYRGEQTAADSD